MTETDVLLAYEPQLREWCHRWGKGIEAEDCFSEAQCALLRAIRTWDPLFSAFLTYACRIVQEHLEKLRLECNRTRSIESGYSLDQCPRSLDVLANPRSHQNSCACHKRWMEDEACFNDFIKKMEPLDAQIAQMLILAYTPGDIMQRLDLSEEVYRAKIQQLRGYMESNGYKM